MKTFTSRRGSALIIALIFGAVAMMIITTQTRSVMQQYESTMRYGLGQSAFHQAESGLELGMYAILEDKLGDSDWQALSSTFWKATITQFLYKGYSVSTDVYVEKDGTDTYSITALSGVNVGDGLVQSAVEIHVKENRTDEQVETSTGSGVFAYGMIAKDGIKMNHNNPGMIIASYNSNVNGGVPLLGTNTGYNVTVATTSGNNNAIQVNNSTVNGTIRTGGGTVSYDSGYNNSNQEDQNAHIRGADSPSGIRVDTNQISNNFDGEVTNPVLPTSDSYATTSYDQNYWQNNSNINIGTWNQPTWVSTERINSNKNTTINIIGDVVFDVQRNLNLGANVEIAEGATLTIIAGENISITSERIDQQHPSQLQIIAKSNQWGAPDVVMNSFKVFTGIINAPNSNVRLAGVGSSPKAQFRGAIIGKYIEVTNGVEFYYDTSLANDGDDDDDGTDENGSNVGELTLLSWAEIPPSSVTTY